MCLPQITHHCRPVFKRSCYNPLDVFKYRHLHQRSTVGLKGQRRALPLLLLLTLLPPLVISYGAHICGLMPVIDHPPCDKHVTLGAAREGVDPFLQDNFCVLHMVVNEVHLECDTACRPP